MDFISRLTAVNSDVNAFVWETLGLFLLVGTGIWTSCLTGFFQLIHAGHWLKNTLGQLGTKRVVGHTKDNTSISQFQALCTALAATVGVGNIAGVAAAIVTGGPGAVFWMWVAALFGMMTSYSENLLGIYYRRKRNGAWAGGAMYYLRDGVGANPRFRILGRMLAALFALFTVLASFGIGNMGQVNKIVSNLESAFAIPALSHHQLYEGVSLYSVILGCVLTAVVAAILLGGLKRIALVTEKVVPTMILLFILGSVLIIGLNFRRVGPAFSAIFRTAFSPHSVWGAAGGIALKEMVACGFKRGMFSNEAGLGSAVMVHANARVTEPVHQGMWGIFEVFVDTLVVCTLTALVVLTGGVIDLDTGALLHGTNDATLVAKTFGNAFGVLGERFIAVAMLLFAFTTILGWSQYGVKAVEYLGGKHGNTARRLYKGVFVALILVGVLLTNTLAWDISDTFNGLMMLPNLVAVLALSGTVSRVTKNYVDRKIRHRPLSPLLSYDPRIQVRMAAESDGTD